MPIIRPALAQMNSWRFLNKIGKYFFASSAQTSCAMKLIFGKDHSSIERTFWASTARIKIFASRVKALLSASFTALSGLGRAGI